MLAGSVSLVAAGYQFDWQTKRLTQTGLLYIAGAPRQVTVTVNDAIVTNRLPFRLASVVPEEYTVQIAKDGYVSWHKRFTIKAGEARTETNVQLYLAKPEVAEVTDPALIKRVMSNTAQSPLINGQEIRLGNTLVTRVSGQLAAAQLSPDRGHVFFQVGREVRVIEKDGTNELLLYTLATEDPCQLVVLSDGKEIALLDGGAVKRLRVSNN